MAIAVNLDSTGNDQTTSPGAPIQAVFHEAETANEVHQVISSVPSHNREPIFIQPQSIYSEPDDDCDCDSSCRLCSLFCCRTLAEILVAIQSN